MGKDDCAPSLVVASAPAALAKESACDHGNPLTKPAPNAPTKVSPAPVVSIDLYLIGWLVTAGLVALPDNPFCAKRNHNGGDTLMESSCDI